MKNKLYLFLQSAAATLPFVIEFTSTEENGTAIYRPQFLTSIEMEKKFILFFGIMALIAVLKKYGSENKKIMKISHILGCVFSFFTVMGKSYSQTASWSLVFSKSCFLAAILIFIGYEIIFSGFLNITLDFILHPENKNIPELPKVDKLFEKHSLLKIWGLILLCWLPYLIINYPAVVHADSGIMLSQYFSGNLSNHNPVVQTIVWGSFVKFGENALGSQSLGVFLFAAVQYLYGSFIVALLFNYVKKKASGACPTLVWLISLLVICLSPAFPRNATAVLKDANYTFYMLLAVYLIILTFDNKEKNIKEMWYLAPLWFFTILLNGFGRKSGIHVLILTLPFVLLYIRENKGLLLGMTCLFVVSLAAYFGGEYAIANVYNIPNDDTQESMSIPFQQTARYVRDYGDEVTPEEREAINAVLDYDSLAESYSPELSNPVKDTFKSESTSEDFSNYLSVWFKMFFKHPTVYFQATLNGIYGYFYPNDIGYYKDLFFMSQCIDTEKIHGPEALEEAADKLVDINMKSRNIPVIGIFSSLGFFIWADIFITVFFAVYKKDKKYLIYNLPLIVTILVCVASPVNNTMRYGLPVMFLAPVLLCMCFEKESAKKE